MKKGDRNIYISNIPVNEARHKFLNNIDIKKQYEEIDIVDSLGRVTFEAVYAKVSSPSYNAAAMDGILVDAEKTYGANERNPITLKQNKDFVYINTGNPILNGYNAVIMIEDVMELEDGKVKIIKPAYPWQHIRPIGEDIVKREMILPSKHKIRAIDVGALISGGINKIKVYKKPRVGIIPTGSEIVEEVNDIKEGTIIDSNSRVFEGLIREYGGNPNRYSPVEDNYAILKESIKRGIEENDILLINAGSSAGSKDFTVKVIREIGEVLVHGIAMKPGKPTILGVIKGKPVIGVPGYPVSSYLSFETFVKPLIYKYIGKKDTNGDTVDAVLTKRLVSSFKNEEFIRVNLGYVDNKFVATPLSSGAGVTMSLVKADGILSIPRKSEGMEAGSLVKVNLLKPTSEIKSTIVSIGSHDLIMDIIRDKIPLISSHVGSMGGVMAMLRGESHISPIHLLDTGTGKYNVDYIKKYFKSKKMALIKGVKRLQGFIVKKGNPNNIKDFNDLTRDNIEYVNRQRGAGTRVLLDYNLGGLGIDCKDIRGYDREMNTHMAVSMAVKSDMATTGLGIKAAANALNLDFVEVGYEDYDFLLPYELLNDERIERFINILKSKEFKNQLQTLGGYKTDNTGSIEVVSPKGVEWSEG